MKRILLRFDNVTTKHNDITGLNDFSLRIGSGEFIGINIINEQGISHLVDIILQTNRPYSGKIYYDFAFYDSKKRNNTAIIDKRIKLVYGTSVAENLFVFRKNFKSFFINHNILDKEVKSILNKYQLTITSLDDTSKLSSLERVVVELLKETLQGRKIIILKDLGELLALDDLKQLMIFISQLLLEGISFIYLGNYPDDVFNYCNKFMIYDEGQIKKIFHSDQIINLRKELEKYNESQNIVNDFYVENPKPIFNLRLIRPPTDNNFLISIAPAQLLVLLDRDKLATPSLFDLVSSLNASSSNVNDQWDLSIIDESMKNSLNFNFIPEDSINKSLFHDCSYMFNFCFSFDLKINRSVFSKKIRESIRKEFEAEIGDKYQMKSIKHLGKYELLNLVYYRMLLLKPAVVFIFQPFVDIDVEFQSHTLKLIDKLRSRHIAVVLVTSYLPSFSDFKNIIKI